jgi:hypothetical protein
VGKAPPKKANAFFQKKKDTDMDVDDPETGGTSYPNPPFKIIILDEADTVTPDAQAALRRIIVSSSKQMYFESAFSFFITLLTPKLSLTFSLSLYRKHTPESLASFSFATMSLASLNHLRVVAPSFASNLSHHLP